MSDKQNSDLFLSTFNRLEKHLKNELFRGQWKSFKQMLKEGSRFNPVLRTFKEELFEFADLRNAIVHNQNNEYKAIAEPHTTIVNQFEEITNTVINPQKVNIFKKKVFTCHLADSINTVANIIFQQRISQVPVLDNNGAIHEIFNANTIAYWLADHRSENSNKSTVLDVLSLKEFKGNFKVIGEEISVYHAAEMYKTSYNAAPKGRYYDALLINKTGKIKQPITGIIVLSDIATYI